MSKWSKMDKLTINKKYVGEEWLKVLKKVVIMREERAKIYGNDWINEPLDYDMWMLYGKVKRAMPMMKDGGNHYEKLEDTLIDLINYSLFALAKIGKKKHGKTNKNNNK
jgi:hypothetical protein